MVDGRPLTTDHRPLTAVPCPLPPDRRSLPAYIPRKRAVSACHKGQRS